MMLDSAQGCTLLTLATGSNKKNSMNKCTCFYFCDYACLHPHQRLKGCKATHTDLPLSVSFHKTEIHGFFFSSLTSGLEPGWFYFNRRLADKIRWHIIRNVSKLWSAFTILTLHGTPINRLIYGLKVFRKICTAKIDLLSTYLYCAILIHEILEMNAGRINFMSRLIKYMRKVINAALDSFNLLSSIDNQGTGRVISHDIQASLCLRLLHNFLHHISEEKKNTSPLLKHGS